ncbi:glycosyltransferase family 1 protein [Hysterangium stoloniferum]|nr:glycosyltransferase family 1 protein [Hysterangium stoloniferum]
MAIIIWIVSFILCALIGRIYALIPSVNSKPASVKKHPNATCHFAIFLASGGHTSEALTLASSLDFSRYAPRTYIVSQGDTLSVQRAIALEASKEPSAIGSAFAILEIPRARRVYQPLVTTPPSAIISLSTCIYHICLRPMFSRQPFSEVLLINGPGTCVMLFAAVFVGRVLFIPTPRVIYVESFARVTSLSLSGRLLRPFVDRFITQWPDCLRDGGRGEYRGWLV